MSKLVKTMIIFLFLLLVGVVIFAVFIYIKEKPEKSEAQSIDKMVEYSYKTPEITTDLKDGSFVRIQFQILTDSESAKEEITTREFQLKNILIKELTKMDEGDVRTNLSELEKDIQSKVNDVMSEGKITDVYTISKILQ
ncbi:flagellar basal body-associated protein FliL [Virgibacillus alimentarius]|uniref:Flagellar protein FliL n=1 Tax=Virgibacillus alimentarius TaxID=698769 RepID=A0ABS4S5M1_9BACI|nr:flagellar basal body-associated protein FliL [Virgibacillus alimentarius]MBP2256204.1 flagellar FliL protein [Virgibacillus alimentarius]